MHLQQQKVMNEVEVNEQLVFCSEARLKAAGDARHLLHSLHNYCASSRKQRAQMEADLVWKGVLTLAKLIGWGPQIESVDQFKIPPQLMLHSLTQKTGIVRVSHHHSRTILDNRKTQTRKCWVLLEGAVQRETTKATLMREVRRSRMLEGGMTAGEAGSRVKKGLGRNRVSVGEEELPECVNVGIGGDILGVVVKCLTRTIVMDVDGEKWKGFMERLINLKEEYIFSFVRRHLGVSLRMDTDILKPEGEKQQIQTEVRQSEDSSGPMTVAPEQDKKQTLFGVQLFERKKTMSLDEETVYMVYDGEVLITSRQYRVEASKGSILNPEVLMRTRPSVHFSPEITAVAKTDSILVHIQLSRLEEHLESHPDEAVQLDALVHTLTCNRRLGQEQDKNRVRSPIQSFQHNPASPRNSFRKNTPQYKYFTVKTENDQHNRKQPYNSKILAFQEIEKRVDSTVKAAQIKEQSYRKSHSPDQNGGQFNSLSPRHGLPQEILKNCMSSIEIRSQLLKQAVRQTRRKRKQAAQSHKQLVYKPSSYGNGLAKKESKADLLRRKVKQMYVRTEGWQEESSEDQGNSSATQAARHSFRRSQGRESFNFPSLSGKFQGKEVFMGNAGLWGTGRRLMKKVQTGKIRQVRMRS